MSRQWGLTPTSNCEKDFIAQLLREGQRLDGRSDDEFRPLDVVFGVDFGTAIATLGETQVLASVTCEMDIPKATRPHEGELYINVETGPMAAGHFEPHRSSETSLQLIRTLERAFKQSNCIDLESLCIASERRVWVIRVSVTVLHHGGNLMDCSAAATLAALAHFRRPDVTKDCADYIVHSAAEKDLIPLLLHHYPAIVTFCTFENGKHLVVDPSVMEERGAESVLVIGVNSFRELCCLNLTGAVLADPTTLLRCLGRAANHAKRIVDIVKAALATDAEARANGGAFGFVSGLLNDRILATPCAKLLPIQLKNFSFDRLLQEEDMEVDSPDPPQGKAAVAEDLKPAKPADAINEGAARDGDGVVGKVGKVDLQWLPEMDSDSADGEASDDSNGGGDAEIVLKRTSRLSLKADGPAPKTAGGMVRTRANKSDSEEEEKVTL